MAQSQSAHTSGRSATGKTAVQKAATLVGIVFLAVGVLGFVPGITTNYGSMQFASHDSAAKLLGLFQVSILHNIVHLLFGIAGVAMSRTESGARSYLLGGGIIYAILWLYGLVIGQESSANFVPVNTADDWLHFLLAVGMIGLALALGRRDRSATRRA
jgi:arginine exporter protein ArgO